MNTYDAILALFEKPSIREMFGKFLGIKKSKDDFGSDFYEAEFEKETLSQWCDKSYFEENNKVSFLLESERDEENGFVVYKRIYMGSGFHHAELVVLFEKEGPNGLAFSYLIGYFDESHPF